MPTDTPDAAPAAQKPTIVLIHGLWLTPLSWEGWKQRFESKGHTVLAPAWPGMEGTVEEVRQNTSKYEGLGIKEITDHYDKIIRDLDSPPIVMGHSFGGLITQLLLDRGLGRAAVALDPAAPRGVKRLPLSSLRAAAPAIAHPSTRTGTVDLDFSSSTTRSPTPGSRRPPAPRSNATRFPRPAASSSRRASQTSRCTVRPSSTTTARSARRC
jgi:non-heme chloroperoxidase